MCKFLRAISGFLYGTFLGILFYELILVDLNFSNNSAFVSGCIICLILGLGNALSSQIRCITLLTFPSFSGTVGRNVVKALVLAYLISGPIQNLINNGKEVVRVFACTTSLSFNLSKTRFELMSQPFKKALAQMKADTREVKDTVNSVQDIVSLISNEVEDEYESVKIKEENDYIDFVQNDSARSDEIDSKYSIKVEDSEAARYEKDYLKKVAYRCETQLSRASGKCRDMFGKAYDHCYETVTWIAGWLFCWPMKLNFVCNVADAIGSSKTCDPSGKLDPGFGRGYAYLKRSKSELMDNFENAKLQYEFVKINSPVDVKDATKIAQMVMHEFEERKSTLDSVLLITKRILSIIFLRIIINAQQYHDSYLNDIMFDNVYVTRYFRKIDARRHSRSSSTILPLKKIERTKLIFALSSPPLKNERQQLFGAIVKLLLEIITVTTFVLLDRLFYEALDLVRRHARIDYTQTGHHDMKLEIRGTGMIAALLRSVLNGFNVKQRVRTITSNAMCLPDPTIIPSYYFYKIYGIYFAVFVLLFLEAYTQRLRHVICAYFYRKREKRRILFLYNETLKRRLFFFRHMKTKVQKLAREQKLQEELSVFVVLSVRFPRACKALKIFGAARRRCIVCEDREPSVCKKTDQFVRCGNVDCYVVYCSECWRDLGSQCLACSFTVHTYESDTDVSNAWSDDD